MSIKWDRGEGALKCNEGSPRWKGGISTKACEDVGE